MKAKLTIIIPLLFLMQVCRGQAQKFRIFGESFSAKQITGTKSFNDLGVKYATSIVNDFTDDEATYLWRLGSVRTNVNDYKAGVYSLFDFSYAGSQKGYPVLDSIDFEFYENWGFNILEARNPDVRKQANYRNFKDSITDENLALNIRRQYLMNYPDRQLRDKLINTKYLVNKQPISSTVKKELNKKLKTDINANLDTETLKTLGVDSTKFSLIYDYVSTSTKNMEFDGFFISVRFDYRYINTICDIVEGINSSQLKNGTDRFNRNLYKYIVNDFHAINTALFAIKFDGSYNTTKIDTTYLASTLSGGFDIKKAVKLAAYLKAEINKTSSRVFSNTFSKVWIIGFGTDNMLDKLRISDVAPNRKEKKIWGLLSKNRK